MDKEKFHIPMPDERTIQAQIEQIVMGGVKPKETFFSYLREMYGRVGIRHLFWDRTELVVILVAAIALLSASTAFIGLEPVRARVHDMYAFIFLVSPVLFLSLSLYTYATKIRNGTYEVEMSCRYHVYQVIAFRMLFFSVVSILVNTVMISFMAMVYDISFFRAFMVSITGLFIFSILFLYAMMQRRSTAVLAATILVWTFGNLLLQYVDHKLYSEVLLNLPLFVYALVIIGSILIYGKYLNTFVHRKHMEEAF
ncbi:hypothetical protein [Brevibacillus borstelensis]|uniref:hypothetical protein n=1 Tax=Brevibacillus borstelensis TaxID=45462 RepID=UPI0030BE0D8E